MNHEENLLKNIEKLRNILQKVENAQQPIAATATMLTEQEQNLLYLVAKEYFTGEGAIFDAGCCTGGCVQSFAKGLFDAGRPEQCYIHAYEWGQCTDQYLKDFLKEHYGIEREIGDSFLDVTSKNLSECVGSDYIKFHPGDILEQEYPETIEILFLDVCKTPQINHAMMQLISRCIPGKSLIVQQDYKYSDTAWINISMGYLNEYLYTVRCDIHNTQVFLLKKAIPLEVLQKDTWQDTSLEEKLKNFTHYHTILAFQYRLLLEKSKAQILKYHGCEEEAETFLDYLATFRYLLKQKQYLVGPDVAVLGLNIEETIYSQVLELEAKLQEKDILLNECQIQINTYGEQNKQFGKDKHLSKIQEQEQLSNEMLLSYLNSKLFRYRILSRITFGDCRKKYKEKKKNLKQVIHLLKDNIC